VHEELLKLRILVPPDGKLLLESVVFRAELLGDLLDLDTSVDLGSFVGSDLCFKVCEVGLLALSESAL
jgi:hypothetical protein